MKLRPTLAHDDIPRDDVLIYCGWLRAQVPCRGEDHAPENFLTPRRFPAEPPLLRTEPPARLVAVRIAPVMEESGRSSEDNKDTREPTEY